MPRVLVGHVTKDGSIAGPRLLEHLVDVVLHFEGDRHATLRLVRAVEEPLRPGRRGRLLRAGRRRHHGLADPRGLFLSRRAEPVPGTCVTVTLEGRRPLRGRGAGADRRRRQLPAPPRAPAGWTTRAVAMMLAVLEQRGPGPRSARATSTSPTVGGVRLTEPAADLAVALARGLAPPATARCRRPGRHRRGRAGRRGPAGSPVSSAGWPRRPGSASPTPSCRRSAASVPPTGCGSPRSPTSGDALRVLPRRRALAPREPRRAAARRRLSAVAAIARRPRQSPWPP